MKMQKKNASWVVDKVIISFPYSVSPAARFLWFLVLYLSLYRLPLSVCLLTGPSLILLLGKTCTNGEWGYCKYSWVGCGVNSGFDRSKTTSVDPYFGYWYEWPSYPQGQIHGYELHHRKERSTEIKEKSQICQITDILFCHSHFSI